MPNYTSGSWMDYPSGNVPVQTLSFLLGDAGLQFTALDGGSQAKQFDTINLDLRITYTCPNAGRPGAANAPDFAVETAAFTGGWWRAAKRYRAWATKQPWTAKGPLAASRFSGRRLDKVQREVEPLVRSGDYYGAFEAFAARSNKIMHPLNIIAVLLAAGVGLLFGFLPLSGMKRQLVSVQRRTDADEYLVPSTFTLTQNSDVLLGTNVSRSIHVQPTSSGGGGSRPSGGGGFHGGSSTHTSSSGGTHGGHSGKF
jgi:hypothetical protein